MEEQLNLEKKEEWHHVVSVEDLGNLKKKIKISYDVDGVKMALEKASDIVREKAQVKGFRKGKAPKSLVQNHFYKEIENHAGSLLAQEGFLHACYEKKVQTLTEPKVENIEFNIDGTFSCDILVEVRPEITPIGYVGLKLKKSKINKEEMFNRFLDDFRKKHATEKPGEEVCDGSSIKVDFSVMSEGKETTSGKDNSFNITKGQEPPFGENLFGMKVGETKVVQTKVQGEDKKEKDSEVTITLKSVINKVLPTDEELVEKAKAPSYEELIKSIKNHVEFESAQKERQAYEELIMDKLIELHSFDVPDRWVEEEEKYFMKRFGFSTEPNLEFKDYINKMAVRNVKRTFILEAIYDVEPDLKLTGEEFEALLEMEAKQTGVSTLTLKENLKKKKMLETVMTMARHGKVVDYIINNAQFEEEQIPQAEVIENNNVVVETTKIQTE
jgi:trigger factor